MASYALGYKYLDLGNDRESWTVQQVHLATIIEHFIKDVVERMRPAALVRGYQIDMPECAYMWILIMG